MSKSWSRATLRLGIAMLAAAAASAAWELLAQQSPGTPLYIGTLSGPIASLRELTSMFGVLLVVASGLLPPDVRQGNRLIVTLHTGALLAIGAQLYAALHGMYGIQATDLRPDALPVFAIKYGGVALLVTALLEIGWRALGRNDPST